MSKLIIKEKKYLLFGLIILMLITFAPLLNIGLVTADDMAILLMNKCNYWGNAYISAIHQGRFFFLITAYFFYLPYLFDSIIWTRLLQFFPIVLIFIGVYSIINQYFNNKKTGIFFLLIYFVFFQLTANYNAFISYHFYFTTAFASLVWGFRFYQLYFKENKKKYLYLSYFLFAFGLLFYEVHIVYSMFFFFLAYSHTASIKNTFWERFKQALLLFKGHFIIVIVYIITMISWAYVYSSQYEGNQMPLDFSLDKYFATVNKLINGALPLNNFFGNFKFFINKSQDISGFNPSYFMFSDILDVSNYIKILLITFFYIFLIKSSNKITFLSLYWGLINGLLMIVLPALILSLSVKYIYYQMEHYTITVFQFFGTALFFISLFLLIDKLLFKIKWAKILSRIIVLIFLIYTSLAHDFANNMYEVDLKQSQSRITFIDEFMKSDYYNKISNQSIIYAPSLWNNHTSEARGVTEQGFNWGTYSNLLHKKERIILRDTTEFDSICKTNTTDNYFYFLVLKQAYHTNDFMLIASKISKDQIGNKILISDTVDIFIYSLNKKASFTYETIADTNQIHTPHNIDASAAIKATNIWQLKIVDKRIDLQSIKISFLD